MSIQCNYVRKNAGSYEYGHIQITNHAGKEEKRIYVPLGNAPSYYEALSLNNMAIKGAPRINHSNAVIPFRRL